MLDHDKLSQSGVVNKVELAYTLENDHIAHYTIYWLGIRCLRGSLEVFLCLMDTNRFLELVARWLRLKHAINLVATVSRIGEALSMASTFSSTLIGMKHSHKRSVSFARP